MNDTFSILVVDDSVTYRKIVSGIVEKISQVTLMGVASNGKIALSKIQTAPPDLVLLDVAMPEMDGLETLSKIKQSFPQVQVVMVSSSDRENANLTVKALSLGALDFISKPRTSSIDDSYNKLADAIKPIVSLAKARKVSLQIQRMTQGRTKEISIEKPIKPVKAEPPPRKTVLTARPQTVSGALKKIKVDVIALGVSTGGPNALQEVIPQLEANFSVPILAVQHMPPTFTASLAERLDKFSKIHVCEGAEGMVVQKGQMYIAPGGIHMIVKQIPGGPVLLGLVDSPPVNSCKPAVDILFRSMAQVYGENILSVILTGMGNDGTSGVSSIRRKGGYSIVQDEATSVVWGMPGAVVSANAADEVLPLPEMANRIMEIAHAGFYR